MNKRTSHSPRGPLEEDICVHTIISEGGLTAAEDTDHALCCDLRPGGMICRVAASLLRGARTGSGLTVSYTGREAKLRARRRYELSQRLKNQDSRASSKLIGGREVGRWVYSADGGFA